MATPSVCLQREWSDATSQYASSTALLREWELLCGRRAELHDRSRVYYMKVGYGITIPSIVVSAAASVAGIGLATSGWGCAPTGSQGNSTSTSTADPAATVNWFQMAFSSAGLMSAAVLAIAQFLRLAELQAANDACAGQFEKLGLEIRMHLALPGATFRDLSEAVKDAKRRLDSLIDQAPPVPRRIEERYDGDGTRKVAVEVRSEVGIYRGEVGI